MRTLVVIFLVACAGPVEPRCHPVPDSLIVNPDSAVVTVEVCYGNVG